MGKRTFVPQWDTCNDKRTRVIASITRVPINLALEVSGHLAQSQAQYRQRTGQDRQQWRRGLRRYPSTTCGGERCDSCRTRG